ncbi:hypothetical protein Tco_0769937 [Tanacetum coccineum]|uniref:Uncharacterized protein n=1 Tax=Tanacetum coccineum TaxID=301880 RepID=A0ABQ4ZDD7_9ASTR
MLLTLSSEVPSVLKPFLRLNIKRACKMQDFEQTEVVDFTDNEIHKLSDDFGKRFTPQQELLAEQAFWLRMSNPTSKPSEASHVKIETPKELPKVSLVNESLKKLKFHLARFDNVVKIRTTPNARTEERSSVFSMCIRKSKKSSHQPKAEDTNQEKLYLLHMDLYVSMRVASINGKSSGPGLHSMTPATSCSGLVPNLIPQQPCIPPLRDDWDRLFQPMFDEYFTPPSIVVSPVQEATALRAAVLADSHVSTFID